MMTFTLDMNRWNKEAATKVADLAQAFHLLSGCEKTFDVSNTDTFGLVVEIYEYEGVTLFGEASLVGNTPILNCGVVNSMNPTARWFVFLAAAHGLCVLQGDAETKIDVIGMSLEMLIDLYNPTEDWQREGIERQLIHFASYGQPITQPTNEYGKALVFF